MAKRGSGATAMAALGVCVILALLAGQGRLAAADYGTPPPAGFTDVEATVRLMVEAAIKSKPSLGPALVRLLFHDCWVNGCDASVLLDKTPFTGSKGVEKYAGNNIGLDGFDLIDQIKAAVGDSVSCADILAFAARDATVFLSHGNINYTIAGGRKDGVYSSAEYADASLPHSTFSFTDLVSNFAPRGFSVEELVVLSGAHSIGVCHKTSFSDRLLPNNISTQINTRYQGALTFDVTLKTSAYNPNPTEMNNIRDMGYLFQAVSGYNSTGVDTAATHTLDNSYYTANLQKMVLLKSDWALTTDDFARDKLKEYRDNGTDWNIDFGNAMAKLSGLTVIPPAGQYQEIRKNCRVINS